MPANLLETLRERRRLNAAYAYAMSRGRFTTAAKVKAEFEARFGPCS